MAPGQDWITTPFPHSGGDCDWRGLIAVLFTDSSAGELQDDITSICFGVSPLILTADFAIENARSEMTSKLSKARPRKIEADKTLKSIETS